MKTFKELISEVSQPNSEDELNFKEKHIIEPIDHPVAPDYVFSGDVDKDDVDGMKRYRKNKRLADYQNPEDMEVYEGISLTRATPGQEGLDFDKDGDIDMTDAQFAYRKAALHKLHKIDEGRTFVIPEAILATERDAFHSTAAAAADAGDDEFYFGQGRKRKKYPVTMTPDAVKTFAGKGKGLAEKVKEPYAVGMAQAMELTSDKPPLSKKTITLAHKIAKGIKRNEAMDPVNAPRDGDVNNDGERHGEADKYIYNRREKISQSIRNKIRTKIKEGFGAVTAAGGDFGDEEESHKIYKKGNMTKKEDVALSRDGKGPGLKIYAGKTNKSQIGEEADPETGHGVFLKGGSVGEKRSGKPIQIHSTPEAAKAQADRLNKNVLTPTEKKYYGLKYHVKPVTEPIKEDFAVELDEAPGQRSSAAYRMTVPLKDGQVHPDHAEKINDLKAKVRADNAKEGTKNKVVLQGRLGKDNPNAPKYKSKYTGKSYPGSHQRIKLGDASHADVYVREDFEYLDEAFKAGIVKLNDGSSVLVRESDAKLLNSLISNLKVENRSKMTQVAMKDKKGFNDILSFAKEAI